MKNKNTILATALASILVASMLLVLPQQLEAQAKSETYPVEVVSSDVEKKHVSNETPVKEKRDTVKMKKPTYEELVADNQEYFDFLIKEKGEEGKKIVEEEKRKLRGEANNAKEQFDVDAVEVGAHSITFGKTLRSSPGGTIKDPVNVVFYNNGRAVDVDTALRTKTPYTWPYAAGSSLYGYIDDTAHGGTAYWKTQDLQHEYGSFWTTRYHIREYDGNYDNHSGGYRFWTMGGVHYEQWNGSGHTVLSWEDAEYFLVENNFRGQSFVNSVGYVNIGNSGTYQGQYND